jgi:Tol biopolymer transport system component
MRDACPAFSPDGRTLAFVRRASLLDSDIHLLDLSPDLKPVAAPRQLTSLHWSVSSPAWTLDGRSLVFSAWPATVNSLWRVDASGLNKPQRLPGVGAGGMHPAISRGGNRLAYARQALDDNIYRLELPTAKGRAKSPQKLIASTYSDYSPQFSPDGKKISFMSDRSGKQEIWVCDSDGSHVTQLTFLDGPLVGYVPEWSPDGQELVFELDQAGHRDIWTVNADGGTLSRVTSGSLNANNPNWSRDGRWVLFDTFTGQLCCQTSKVPAEGGPVARVTTEGGWGPVESPDGKYIYSVGNSPDGPTLVRTPAGGGKTELVIDSIINGDAWTVVEDGIYFVKKPGPGSGYSIQFLNTSTGVVHQIADFERPVWGRLSVSPDRRWILYTQTDQEGSDLMLVENFH